MTKDARDPAAGEVGDGVTGGAALIATFYGRRGSERIRKLYERSHDLDETTRLRFDPPGQGAHDTTALQLGMNALGDAAHAWEGLRGKLESILDAKYLEGIWGYTLVYQAVVEEGYDVVAVLGQVQLAARRLHSAGELAPIRTFKVAGGLACLLGAPEPVGGPDAGMVYAALGPREGEKALLQQFYSMSDKSVAELLPPDIIAHKGYYEMRQHRTGDLELRYQKSVKDLAETTSSLLEDLREDDLQDDASPDMLELLKKLFRLYSRLLPVASDLKKLQVGILQQSENLYRWRSQFGDNEALEFHQGHLDIAIRELESKVEPLQFDLEIADRAVSAARLQLDREQEERRREEEKEEAREKEREEKRRRDEEQEEDRYQRRIQTLLAGVAAALALPAMIDKDVAGWVMARIPVLEPLEGNTIAELVAQIVLLAILAIPILLGVRFWLNRRRSRG